MICDNYDPTDCQILEYSPTMIYKTLGLRPRPMKHAYNLTSLETETGKEFKVILSNRIILRPAWAT